MTSSKRLFIVAVVVCIAGAIVAGVRGTLKHERERGRPKAAVSTTQKKKGDQPEKSITFGGIPLPVVAKEEVDLYASAAKKFFEANVLTSVSDILARGNVDFRAGDCITATVKNDATGAICRYDLLLTSSGEMVEDCSVDCQLPGGGGEVGMTFEGEGKLRMFRGKLPELPRSAFLRFRRTGVIGLFATYGPERSDDMIMTTCNEEGVPQKTERLLHSPAAPHVVDGPPRHAD